MLASSRVALFFLPGFFSLLVPGLGGRVGYLASFPNAPRCGDNGGSSTAAFEFRCQSFPHLPTPTSPTPQNVLPALRIARP